MQFFPERSQESDTTPFIVSFDLRNVSEMCIDTGYGATNGFYPVVAAGNVFQSHEFLAGVPTENIPITVERWKQWLVRKSG